MPLSASVLGPAIADAVGALSPEDKKDLTKIWTAAAEKIIEHITSQAIITIAPGAVATGVTPGGAAVPVTGTATIT